MNHWLTIAALVLICAAFFSFKAGDITLQFTGDENFYYESSRRMLETGDWLTPQYYGEKRFQKPFLFYWLEALSFKAFGVNWRAARLPSILFGALTVLLTYLIGKELFSKGAGLFSSMILATSMKFFRYTRAAIPDMVLLFFTTLAVYFFIKGRGNPGKRRIFFIGIFIVSALATLTKGPIGLIIPLLVIIAFIILAKERSLFKDLGIGKGMLIYALIVAPWFLAMLKLHGADYISQIWTREIFHRVGYFSETKHGIALFLEYLKSLFFYIPVIFVRFLPWSLFLPFALFQLHKAKKKNAGSIFTLTWFSAVFIFFSIIGEKHTQYILALAPAFALILGDYFRCGIQRGSINKAFPIGIACVTAVFFIAAFSFPVLRPNSAILAQFALRITEEGLQEGDEIGVGSHSLIPQKIEVYLDRPVKRVCVKLYDLVENERLNKLRLKQFFTQKARAYCIIKKEDYLTFVEPALRNRLSVIDKDFLWKRKFSLGDRSLKDEYWLVTNQ